MMGVRSFVHVPQPLLAKLVSEASRSTIGRSPLTVDAYRVILEICHVQSGEAEVVR